MNISVVCVEKGNVTDIDSIYYDYNLANKRVEELKTKYGLTAYIRVRPIKENMK
ncbi:MAG: hypothetical protein ACM3UU_02910 [Ignavibacteriales bacterium]